MKIIWFSTVPYAGVGYGVITRAICTRMIADGHEVIVATKHQLGGSLVVDGLTCFDGTQHALVNKIAEDEKYDHIISCMDHWVMEIPFIRWTSVNFIDTEFVHPRAIRTIEASKYKVAVTEHGMRELERAGYSPIYAPLGVDTKLFRPDPERRQKTREKKGWTDETFVVGIVGINYKTDRKNIVNLVRAFQGFQQRHSDSILYLHTDVMGSASQGLPLKWIIGSCGFPDTTEGVSGPVQYIEQKRYHLWDISDEYLAGLYNAMDVFCLPSVGEGFGLPWLEAQASGTPVIAVDTTSGKQLCMSGWLIPQQEDYYKFSTLLTWNVVAPPSIIDDYLEKAYQAWKSGKIKKYQIKARKKALDYDWDTVYAKYWRPLLKTLEENKPKFRLLPDYGTVHYQEFGGRLLLGDCANPCKDRSICDFEYPLLPGEWKDGRCILSRSYPIVPDREGNFLVCTKCPVHKVLTPRFIQECKTAWEDILAYPKVREALKELWDSDAFKDWGEFRSWEEISHEFDAEYASIIQEYYWTTYNLRKDAPVVFPAGGKILDVGCGFGLRVQELKQLGFEAIGCEVNPAHFDEDTIPGSAEALPFEDNSFDGVLCIDVLEHLEHPLKAIEELLRVTKGPALVVITPVGDPTYLEDPTHKVPWSADRWAREILALGDIATLLPGMTAGFVLTKREKEWTTKESVLQS